MNTKPQDATPAAGGRAAKAAPQRLQSRELFGAAQEVIIEHAGETYRLRCTSKGKLILTK